MASGPRRPPIRGGVLVRGRLYLGPMRILPGPDDLKHAPGLGVAGNFTGHLEQAGEAGDFRDVAAAEGAPKGLFPFYLPGSVGPLAVDPLSHDTIRLPSGSVAAGHRYQIEPEVALWCTLDYAEDGLPDRIHPVAFAAFNDCSHRSAEAPADGSPLKISRKKHWGPCSQGCATDAFRPLSGFEPGDTLDHLRIASFLKRDGVYHPYGEQAPVCGYRYFHGRLLDWVVDRLRHQKDQGPLEALTPYFQARRPNRLLLSIGATRYLPYGEATFLRTGDQAAVVLFDPRDQDATEALVNPTTVTGSRLVQQVIEG